MCPDVAYRDYPRALIHAKHAVELEPRNATYAYTLGITYRFLNDRKRALEELGRAIELNPASGTAYELRSHIYRDFGDYERALADALKAVELARTSPWVHKTLSDAYRNVGQGEKALTAANRALELNPTPNANTTFYFYEARGLAYRQLGNHAAAIADFKTAVELAPFRSWTYRERALSEFRLKLYEAALADIAKAVELNPDDNPFNLTEIPPEEAAVCPDESFRNGLLGLIDRNIERSQSSATAYRIRARFHAAGGKWAEAIADYSKIVELLPQGARGRNNLAWQLATCPEARFQDPPRAVELAKKATELTPQQGAYWNTLGAAYYRAGQWNESIAALEKSIELRRGGDSNDWFFLAMANWQLGEHAKAREWYDKAVQWMDKNQPTNKELRGFRAEADELMKN
jgi:tetratricopeptide (TPR) repeat protein